MLTVVWLKKEMTPSSLNVVSKCLLTVIFNEIIPGFFHAIISELPSLSQWVDNLMHIHKEI